MQKRVATLVAVLMLLALVTLIVPTTATAGPPQVIIVQPGEPMPEILFTGGDGQSPPPIIQIVDEDGNIVRLIQIRP